MAYTLVDDAPIKGSYTLIDEEPKQPGINDRGGMLQNIAGGILRGAGSIGSTIMAPIDMVARSPFKQALNLIPGGGALLQADKMLGGNTLIGRDDRRAAMDQALTTAGVNTDSGAFKTGKIGTEIAGTLGVGGAIAKPVQALAATRYASGMEPVMEGVARGLQTGGFRIGELANAGRGANAATRAITGAVTGGATAGLVNPEDAPTGAMISGALPGAVRGAGKIGSTIYQAASGLARPLTQKGQQQIALEILQASASNPSQASIALSNSSPLLPGSMPTVGQVAGDAGLAQLERTLYNNPETQAALQNAYKAQSLARLNTLRNIAGSEAAISAQEAARDAATSPIYNQAKNTTYFVDDRLSDILSRPSVKNAMDRAKRIAADDGRKFGFTTVSSAPFKGVGGGGEVTRRNITGQSLQDLKMAMDDMLRDPASGIVGKEADQVKSLRGKIVDWMESANPEFGQARKQYSEMSRPINEMQVGRELLNKLQPALSDFGATGNETAATYARQLRDSGKLVQKATGFKGAGTLEQVMSPENMQALESIAKDLALKSNGQNLGRAVGSPTMQNMMGQNLINRIAQNVGLPKSFSESVVANTLARPYDFVMRSAQPEINALLVEAMADPRKAAALLNASGQKAGLLGEPEALGLLSSAAYRIAPVLASDQ